MASAMANKTILPDQQQVCVSIFHEITAYKGIFISGNPIDFFMPIFMIQLISSVAISWAIYLTLRPFKQSKFVCNLLAGIILGPSVFGRNKSYMGKMFPPKEMIVLATLSNMATTLFIFVTCIKMNRSMVFKLAKKTWKISLACVAIPFILTLAHIALLQQFLPGIKNRNNFPLQFSIASSLSYFIVITQSLDELNLVNSELGQLSTSITMFNEIIALFIIAVLGLVVSHDSLPQHLLRSTLPMCGLIVFGIVVIRPILKWIIKTTPKGKPVRGDYVIAIIVCALLMGMTSDALAGFFSPGVMILGFIIPDGPPLGSTIIQKTELIISEFFLPLFFIYVGYHTDLSTIFDWKELAFFVAVILAAYIGRLAGCYMLSSSANISKSDAIMLSLILSLQGLVELLQGIRWKHSELVSDQDFSTLVMSIVVLNGIITPIIETYYKPKIESVDLVESVKHSHRSLGMTSMIGELRIISCIEEDNVASMVSLLNAMNPRALSPICAYIIHLVPLATQTVPILLPYKNHKRMYIKPNGSDNIMRAFLNYSKNSEGPVQIQPYRMVSPVKYMHEQICRLAEATNTPLLIVPFFKTQQVHNADGTLHGTLRMFNTNIQTYARCTVGILVDRGRPIRVTITSFSYSVAVVFIGGADDREALAFAARMSSHRNIAISIFKINLRGNIALGFGKEREIDESFYKEFKAMTAKNECVVRHELEAENIADVMGRLRSLANGFDLVVVGKRQGFNTRLEQELIEWTEYPELGVIGDAIAHPDFCGGTLSILVLRHFGVADH
ncbi:Cation/H+ exchanger [Corchorus olitorius]|uniref:Cation/H+ exchanger n=1 Tax=Corchorus olitorius TaxID=93759 RepID=A0A1R3HF48_9ROSI|nr:Cation/H+ exchanger [Corchorus olitorius]